MPPNISPGYQPAEVLVAQLVPSSAATVSFSGLTPTEFTFYKLNWFLGTSAGSDQQLRLQVNGDSTTGHYQWALSDGNSNTNDTAATIGWAAEGSQGFTSGVCVFPAQHGGAIRGSYSQCGGNGAAERHTIGSLEFTFQISSNITSISLFAASGNLTGTVNLVGVY